MSATQSTAADVDHEGVQVTKDANAASFKIDPITALQEGIDGLSLAMFEALRGLRNAVAPDSGNLGVNANGMEGGSPSGGETNTTNNVDVEELWLSYCNGDEEVVKLVRESKFNPGGKIIKKRDEFVKWHRIVEREKDTELVQKLAVAVLEKSEQIDNAVDGLPGMYRNREQQMIYVEELIQKNEQIMKELTKEYERAIEIRNQSREFILNNTASALGISGM